MPHLSENICPKCHTYHMIPDSFEQPSAYCPTSSITTNGSSIPDHLYPLMNVICRRCDIEYCRHVEVNGKIICPVAGLAFDPVQPSMHIVGALSDADKEKLVKAFENQTNTRRFVKYRKGKKVCQRCDRPFIYDGAPESEQYCVCFLSEPADRWERLTKEERWVLESWGAGKLKEVVP